MNLSSLDLGNLSPEDRAVFDAAVEELEGFVANKDGVGLVLESIEQRPSYTYPERHADCVGKVKHWMRSKIAVVVDFIWATVEPTAEQVILESEALCGVGPATPNGVPSLIHTAELNAGIEGAVKVPAEPVIASPPVSTVASSSGPAIAPPTPDPAEEAEPVDEAN